ncbi:hypothetical protein C8Q80DRAFT_1265207 [Daedaleopsis nitida]|nr:hypothetical protein C8Q80DRAFT_1265207 [Daedaleopsis nitida]
MAYQDAHSIEARKARYSQELAAYTLRQWDLVRQTMEDDKRGEESKKTPSPPRHRSGSVAREAERSSRTRQGIQVHDYAQSAHRHPNGGRAVAA